MQLYRKEEIISRENLKMRNPETTRGRNCKNTPQISLKFYNFKFREDLELGFASFVAAQNRR